LQTRTYRQKPNKNPINLHSNKSNKNQHKPNKNTKICKN
jgi:hypothetical protein